MDPGKSGLACLSLPDLDGPRGVRQLAALVDEEERLAVDADRPLVEEGREEPGDVPTVVLLAVGLRLEDVVLLAVPAPRPRLVRPAEAEGEVGPAAREHLLERALEQLLSREPVVVVTEAGDSVGACQLGLRLARLGEPEVVEAEARRQARLVVAVEEGPRVRDVAPLREAFAPPDVVLGNRVELGEVEGDQLQSRRCRRSRPTAVTIRRHPARTRRVAAGGRRDRMPRCSRSPGSGDGSRAGAR